MTIARGYLNNFSTTLTNNITNSATTFDIVSATGISTLLGTSDYILMTIDDGTNVEIVKVTGISTLTLTVVRGQNGTSGTAFNAGSDIEIRLTESTFDSGFDIFDQVTLAGSETEILFEDLTPGVYEIDILHLSVDNSGSPPMLLLRVGTGGTPTYQTTTYKYSVLNFADNSGTITNVVPGSTTYITLWDAMEDGNVAFTTCGTIKTSELGSATKYKLFDIDLRQTKTGAGAQVQVRKGAAAWNDTTAVTALKIYPDAGAFRAGGVVTLLKRRF